MIKEKEKISELYLLCFNKIFRMQDPDFIKEIYEKYGKVGFEIFQS